MVYSRQPSAGERGHTHNTDVNAWSGSPRDTGLYANRGLVETTVSMTRPSPPLRLWVPGGMKESFKSFSSLHLGKANTGYKDLKLILSQYLGANYIDFTKFSEHNSWEIFHGRLLQRPWLLLILLQEMLRQMT